ncbi:MAG: glycine zipper 2TM domain-containing protein [Thiobacillaceae bacterium]
MTTKQSTTRKLALAALVAALAASGASWAKPPFKREYQDAFHDTAWVVARTPVYEEVNTPRRECWTEQVGYEYSSPSRSYGGAIIGAIAGGILGNQVGKGTGKTVATAVGAATGAIVGDNIDNDGHRSQPVAGRPIMEERCRMVDQWERRLTGYNVVYRYQGREYTAFLPYDPGSSVRVRVQVSLAE